MQGLQYVELPTRGTRGASQALGIHWMGPAPTHRSTDHLHQLQCCCLASALNRASCESCFCTVDSGAQISCVESGFMRTWVVCTVDSGVQVTGIGRKRPDRDPVTSALDVDISDVGSCDTAAQLCQGQACGPLWAVSARWAGRLSYPLVCACTVPPCVLHQIHGHQPQLPHWARGCRVDSDRTVVSTWCFFQAVTEKFQ